MKVSVLQENLAQGLNIVSRAVSPRSTLPVLSNVLVATDEGRLRLSATNLELGITCWIGAKIEEEGSTTVPARTFTELIGTLSDQQVEMSLSVRTQTLNIQSNIDENITLVNDTLTITEVDLSISLDRAITLDPDLITLNEQI